MEANEKPKTANSSVDLRILGEIQTNKGEDLAALSQKQPIMLFFLRHFGCTFCREALDEISKKRKSIEESGIKIVFVHMADEPTAKKYFTKFKMPDATFVGDSECKYYAHFGLIKGSATQLFGLQSFVRGFQSGILKGYGLGGPIGDGFQMPGIFIIFRNEIRESYVHKLASDVPDYMKLAKCCEL